MMHKAWSSIEEVPYCFSRSSVKFEGHTALKIVKFDPNWLFPDYRPVVAFKSLRFALFKYHHQGCLNYPIFSNLGLCTACFVCHRELWPTWELFLLLSQELFRPCWRKTLWECYFPYFYTSAFRCQRHYVFGSSLRPKPEIPSFHLYMGPLVHPTNRDRFAAFRPSVRPETFQGICQRTHGGNGLNFWMLMYLDHHQNWLDYGHGLLIFLILALFWLRETGQIWVSGHLPENALRKWPGIVHADVSWSPSELLSYGYSLLIFLTSALFWLWSNLGFPAILVMLCRFSSWCPFDWNWSHILGFWAFSGERVGVNVEGGGGGRRHISDTLRGVLSS